jgi:hypothetical protein
MVVDRSARQGEKAPGGPAAEVVCVVDRSARQGEKAPGGPAAEVVCVVDRSARQGEKAPGGPAAEVVCVCVTYCCWCCNRNIFSIHLVIMGGGDGTAVFLPFIWLCLYWVVVRGEVEPRSWMRGRRALLIFSHFGFQSPNVDKWILIESLMVTMSRFVAYDIDEFTLFTVRGRSNSIFKKRNRTANAYTTGRAALPTGYSASTSNTVTCKFKYYLIN